MRNVSLLIMALIGLLSVAVVNAQSECLAIFRSALISTALECEDTEAGRLCYGNLGAEAERTAEAGTQAFSFPGHELPVTDVQALTTSNLVIDDGVYGVIVASVADAFSENDAQMVVFGGVELTINGAGAVTIPLEVTFADGAFSREAPDNTATQVMPLGVGENVLAVGRNADASWLQVIIPDGRVAWVLASLVAPINDGIADFVRLTVAEDDPITYAPPLRDIALQTVVESSPCTGVPQGGLLVQAPEDSPFMIRVNGFTLTITKTVYIRAINTDNVRVYAIDDEVTITDTDGESLTINAGETHDSDAEIRVIDTAYRVVEHLPYELLPQRVMLPSNWLDVIIPASDENPLTGLTTDSPCTAYVGVDVNVRVGPGTEYQRRGSLLANQSANPLARAVGTDGRVWWEIGDGAWVANDVVVIGGNCTNVPQAEVLPRLR